jgi:hypothetical protein
VIVGVGLEKKSLQKSDISYGEFFGEKNSYGEKN